MISVYLLITIITIAIVFWPLIQYFFQVHLLNINLIGGGFKCPKARHVYKLYKEGKLHKHCKLIRSDKFGDLLMCDFFDDNGKVLLTYTEDTKINQYLEVTKKYDLVYKNKKLNVDVHPELMRLIVTIPNYNSFLGILLRTYYKHVK